jgi:hypothetical protein
MSTLIRRWSSRRRARRASRSCSRLSITPGATRGARPCERTASTPPATASRHSLSRVRRQRVYRSYRNGAMITMSIAERPAASDSSGSRGSTTSSTILRRSGSRPASGRRHPHSKISGDFGRSTWSWIEPFSEPTAGRTSTCDMDSTLGARLAQGWWRRWFASQLIQTPVPRS